MKPREADLEPETDVAQAKKPYTTPSLTVHGGIERITQAGGISGTDGPIGSTVI